MNAFAKRTSIAVFGVLTLGLGVYGTVTTLASQRPDSLSFGGDRLVKQINPLSVDGSDDLRAKESDAKHDDLRAKEADAKHDDLRAKESDAKHDDLRAKDSEAKHDDLRAKDDAAANEDDL